MNSRTAALALLLSLTAALDIGCAHRRQAETAAPKEPPSVHDLDDFAFALNEFALMTEQDPNRGPFRDALLGFLVEYIEGNIRDEEHQEALTALQFAAALYHPSELRGSPKAQPDVARVARTLYKLAARHGNEQPAMFSLAMIQQFGTEAQRARAIEDWKEIEDWVLRNAYYREEPLLRHEELQATMYETAVVFPAPFVVKRLSDLYIARYKAAVRVSDDSSALGMEARRRAEYTSYLLARLYLRADDLEGAIKALRTTTGDDVISRRGAELIQLALDDEKSAEALLTLAAQFKPDEEMEGDPQLIPSQLTESWGIVENLARRAVRRFPDDPSAHVLYAEALRQSGLLEASIHHFELALDRREDVFEVWQQLALLKQAQLSRLGERDPKAALKLLRELETFHARAVELWRDRPIEPGLPVAYYTIALMLYNAGEVDRARSLLDKSLALEPQASALDLLATIEYKSGRFDQATSHYQALLGLPFEHQLHRLRWETSARAGLSRIARSKGDSAESDRQLRTALRELNTMIAFPGLTDQERSERLIERGKLMFYAGDLAQSLADFRQARTLAPEDSVAFTEPMLFVVSHGYYAEALEIYRAALANDALRDTLKLYFSLWLNELALRQGESVDADSLSFINSYIGASRSDDAWARSLAMHAQGKLSYEELLTKAGDDGERAEAHFYEGLRRWRSGNETSGKELMRKVLSTKMMSFFEYDMARSYLEWNELPQRGRPVGR